MLYQKWLLGVGAGLMVGALAGCSNFPVVPTGDRSVVGGSAMAAGEKIAPDGGLISTLTVGAGDVGANVVGASWSKIREHANKEAVAAAQNAEAHPAQAADVNKSATADLNGDGFVTVDEIAAMQQAGLSDQQIAQRMEQSRDYFEVSSAQEQYLRDHAVRPAIVDAMKGVPTNLGNEAQTAAAEIGPSIPSK